MMRYNKTKYNQRTSLRNRSRNSNAPHAVSLVFCDKIVFNCVIFTSTVFIDYYERERDENARIDVRSDTQ